MNNFFPGFENAKVKPKFKLATPSAIEMENFQSTNTENIQMNNFFPGFENAKVKPKFKLATLLIFLSSDKFKYCILPYLSSQSFVKICLHFQNLVPELNFQTFLPPSRFYTDTNHVFDILEPTTFLQPLEIKLLYQFYGKYSSLKSHILYSFKKEIPIIVESHVPIPPNCICAHLSQNKIIPYETYVIPTFHQKLLILKDDKSDQFFVTFEKSRGQFINIARSNGVSEKEFSDYVECIWEAYNLQGWKKNYWKLKSFLTMAYVKYLFYVVRMISCLGDRLLHYVGIIDNYFKSDNSCFLSFVCAVWYVVYLPIIAMVTYTGAVLWYYASMLPFFVLAFPLKHFFFGFNLYSFIFVSPSLASLYVCFFPQIKKCMPYSSEKTENIELKNILPNILKSFEIKPQKIMSVVPLLVQKRKNCWVECVDTFLVCVFIFTFDVILSPFFLVGKNYF